MDANFFLNMFLYQAPVRINYRRENLEVFDQSHSSEFSIPVTGKKKQQKKKTKKQTQWADLNDLLPSQGLLNINCPSSIAKDAKKWFVCSLWTKYSLFKSYVMITFRLNSTLDGRNSPKNQTNQTTHQLISSKGWIQATDNLRFPLVVITLKCCCGAAPTLFFKQ